MRPVRLIGATAAVAAVALAGCGGGSSGSSTASTFKQGYATERVALNAIAEQVGMVIDGADKSTDAAIAGQLNAIEPRYKAELARLVALKPPSELTAAFAAVTTPSRGIDTDLARLSAAVGTHDASGSRAAAMQLGVDVTALQAAASTLRTRLGLPASS